MVNAGKAKFLPFPFFRIFPLKCSVFNLPYYSIKEGRNKVKSGENPLCLCAAGKKYWYFLKRGLLLLEMNLVFSKNQRISEKNSRKYLYFPYIRVSVYQYL